MARGRANPPSDESSEEPPAFPVVVNDRFDIKGKIGSGSYSEVQLGKDRVSGSSVAVKFEWIYADKTGKLLPEAGFYESLAKQGNHGAPRILWSGREGEYNVMVMDLLGPSVEDLLRSCGNKLGLKTVVRLASQMIDRLEFVHSCGILHRDIKPNNFLMGIHDKMDEVYIMDFGLAKKYLTDDGSHIPEIQKKGLTGTVRYTSMYVHKGVEPSRRDDLASVGYVLIYLLLGRLPWQGINANSKRTKQRRIGKRKEQTSHEDLCKDLPHEFVDFLAYCDALKFNEKPDYDHLRRLMHDAGDLGGAEKDARFDWHRLGVFHGAPKEPQTEGAAAAASTRPAVPEEAANNAKRRKIETEAAAAPTGAEVEAAAAPTGAEVEAALTRSAEAGHKRRRTVDPHTENADLPPGTSFVWTVTADQVRTAEKGARVESNVFQLEGGSGNLRLRYWPKGHKKAAATSCSAYLWAENAGTMQMKLYVNRKSKLLDKDGPVVWKANNDRGYADFCAIPEGDADVQIKVVLLQGVTQAVIPDVSEDDYEYETETSEELTSSEYETETSAEEPDEEESSEEESV